MRSIAGLVPYARNARTHSPEQVAQIAASIQEFGWTNPVLVDEHGGIIAGHGRVLAAQHLGMVDVPCIELRGLTEAQKRAYVLADNQLALNSGWDEALLAQEIDALKGLRFDLSVVGFSPAELESLIAGAVAAPESPTAAVPALDGNTYTTKIKIPIYEPKGDRPPVRDLFDDTKTKALVAEIDAAGLPDEVASFLRLAAERHTVFNFRNIAEYYAHADAQTQSLMERSALVIIDFNAAIENGFVRLTERLGQLADKEGWNGAD